ncbi:MAG: FtsB family cell division protein [Phenylobacterium sp.]
MLRESAGIAWGFQVLLAHVRPYLPTVLLVLLIVYFAMNALTGERGLLSSNQRDAALTARTRELAQVRSQRQNLEMRARLLRDTSLSRDLLEERARSLLGFADPRDYVIRMKP